MTAGAATSGRESAEGTLRIRIGPWPRSPVFYGIVVAVVAGVAGQYLHISPPAPTASARPATGATSSTGS